MAHDDMRWDPLCEYNVRPRTQVSMLPVETAVSPKLESTQLYRWLKRANEALAQHVVSVRDEQAKWLPLIVATFPHYPGHGVEHSERIIAQLSLMLFDGAKPVVKFSAVEVYCLLCAAYLHDMGMVVSPGEVATILTSEPWKAFVSVDGEGHKVFTECVALRKRRIEGSEDLARFLADQALRYLVAEFVRHEHHERGKTTLEMHPFLKQLVSDNDSVAFETIAEIGIGHGLSDSELLDGSRFPEERDVFGEKVNVRFLARLLRIGDLLDMSTKRADPMTARGVGPLPPDAVPHWQQYSYTKHECISPKVIEFTFECENQETHAILRDWFGCLEVEVRNASLGQMHAGRHDNWKAPRCIVRSQSTADPSAAKSGPTIIIKPSSAAKYTFHDWKLELDHEQVLQRLISDVYDDPSVFVRELIQNALDATRCQMFVDFEAQDPDVTPPARPTQFSSDFLKRYPVIVSLAEEDVQLSPDGPTEKRQVFTIEDFGTGMSEDIIRRYFLQVGRSYYQSSEFRERFKFAPTSRFGIGFLSVFAVSDDVTVETAYIDAASGKSAGIKLRLRGPKSYLLTETWDGFAERPKQDRHGTRIRVVINVPRDDQSLKNLVGRWCVQIEVPIRVHEGGHESVLSYVPLIDGETLAQSRVDPNARFIQRVFDVNSHGIEGQMTVLAYVDDRGEGWCDCWSREQDLTGERRDPRPGIPHGYLALHGIALHGGYVGWHDPGWDRASWSSLLDVRSETAIAPMSRVIRHLRDRKHFLAPSRQQDTTSINDLAQSASEDVVQEAVEAHLATAERAKGDQGCYYVGKVLSVAPVSDPWRTDYPGTIITWDRGERIDRSAAELLALDCYALAYWVVPFRVGNEPYPPMKRHPSTSSLDCPILSMRDTPEFVEDRLKERSRGMTVVFVKAQDDLWLIVFGQTTTNVSPERVIPDAPWYLADLGADGPMAVWPGPGNVGSKLWSLLNTANPYVQWLIRLHDASDATPGAVDPAAVLAAWRVLAEYPYKLDDCVARWRTATGLRSDLLPPTESEAERGFHHYLDVVERRTIIASG